MVIKTDVEPRFWNQADQFFSVTGMASCDSTGPDYTWTIAMGANKQEINVINARTLHTVDTIHSPVMDHFMQNGCIW